MLQTPANSPDSRGFPTNSSKMKHLGQFHNFTAEPQNLTTQNRAHEIARNCTKLASQRSSKNRSLAPPRHPQSHQKPAKTNILACHSPGKRSFSITNPQPQAPQDTFLFEVRWSQNGRTKLHEIGFYPSNENY